MSTKFTNTFACFEKELAKVLFLHCNLPIVLLLHSGFTKAG